MKTIRLNNVKPNVFSESEVSGSEIWCTNNSFECGKFYLICSESGKGKSSLFDFMYCRRYDYSGDIFFDDQNIRQLNEKQKQAVRTSQISLVFQGFRLFPELTTFENIEIKNNLSNFKTEKEIDNMLELLGITEKKHIPLGLLSFGQQQRVAIVRALCQPFQFLFIDEAFSHLDTINSATACSLITAEVKRQNASLIVASLGDAYTFDYDKKIML